MYFLVRAALGSLKLGVQSQGLGQGSKKGDNRGKVTFYVVQTGNDLEAIRTSDMPLEIIGLCNETMLLVRLHL